MPPRRAGKQEQTEMDLEGFGGRVRDRREDLGLNQLTFARLIGCCPSMARRYERGLNVPTVVMLVRLAKALETSLDYLVLDRRTGGLIDRRVIELLRDVQRLSPARLNEFLRMAQAFLKPEEVGSAGPDRKAVVR
jgi:transcriptional regulator with XRE-family HTH domain